MDNMGGLRKLYYIYKADFSSLTPMEYKLYSLELVSDMEPYEIPFTQETGKISEIEEMSDNGLIYKFEVSCSIPKCDTSTIDLLGELKLKEILILAEDNNDNLWLTGAPGSYFNISIASDTGANIQDKNSRQLKIAASLPVPSVFLG